MKNKKTTKWSIDKGDYQRFRTSEKQYSFKSESKEKVVTIALSIIIIILLIFSVLFV